MVAKEKRLGDRAKAFVAKAKESATAKARATADLNADGRVDAGDARIAAAWSKDKTVKLGKKAADAAKAALQTDLGKDVATGASIGAVAAIPVPVVGPLAGAAIGAGVGVYRNVKKKRPPPK